MDRTTCITTVKAMRDECLALAEAGPSGCRRKVNAERARALDACLWVFGTDRPREPVEVQVKDAKTTTKARPKSKPR